MVDKIKKYNLLLLANPFFIFNKLICGIRSWYYTRKINEGEGKIKIQDPFLKFKIVKGKKSTLVLNGNLIIQKYNGLINPVYIQIGDNALMHVDGEFVLGAGVRIVISNNAVLNIGGREKESGSGITADTLIMVYRKISIGKDLICAWNVFISDSDWHHIEGQSANEDVYIGDHVWIANSNNILKGTRIGNNCIIGSNSKLLKQQYADNSMIAGMPAKIVKSNVEWRRDIQTK